MRNKLSRVLALLGLLLIGAAIFWAGWNTAIQKQGGQAAEEVMQQLSERIPLKTAALTAENAAAIDLSALPDYVLNPSMPMPETKIGGRLYVGYLSIPSLELELGVCKNLDYDNLKVSPCLYHGSAYTDDLVISGHNYDRHFGKLSSLHPGDEITFTDIDGNVFRYRVALIEVLESDAVEEMTDSGFALSLFTCTVGGAARVTVRCDRQLFP